MLQKKYEISTISEYILNLGELFLKEKNDSAEIPDLR